MKRIMLFAVAAAMTIALASPAMAEPMTIRTQLSVNHADLNLSEANDASALLRRFRGAARMACGDTPAKRSLTEMTRIRACTRTSMEHAVARANNAMVSELYYGRRPAITVDTVAN